MIFNSAEEVQAFIDGLDDTTAKWKIVDFGTNDIVEGCESMTDRAQYVWIMENQPVSEVQGEGVARYDVHPLDANNADMPWLASE